MVSASVSLESSSSTPVMDNLDVKRGLSIAKNLGGARIIGADMPVFLADNFRVAGRKTDVSGAERAMGARIREARERLGVSINELGLAMGGSRQQVQFWEKGSSFPALADFPRLCRLLKTDANTLLGMSAMPTLNDTDIVSARMQIQAMAQAAKDNAAVRRGRLERLQRRKGAA